VVEFPDPPGRSTLVRGCKGALRRGRGNVNWRFMARELYYRPGKRTRPGRGAIHPDGAARNQGKAVRGGRQPPGGLRFYPVHFSSSGNGLCLRFPTIGFSVWFCLYVSAHMKDRDRNHRGPSPDGCLPHFFFHPPGEALARNLTHGIES
jgi:hypothetical protein